VVIFFTQKGAVFWYFGAKALNDAKLWSGLNISNASEEQCRLNITTTALEDLANLEHVDTIRA